MKPRYLIARDTGAFLFSGCSMDKEKLVAFLKSMGGIKLSQQSMKELCPKCFEIMQERNITAIDIAELAESEHFLEAGFTQGMCDAMGGAEGFFTRCNEKMAGKVDDAKAFCAALHNHCLGKYPSQKETAQVSDSLTLLEAGPEGREFEVVLIEAGFSKNIHPKNNLPILYPEETLSKPEVIQKFNGLPAKLWEFDNTRDHLPDAVRAKYPEGFPKTTVGIYENARFGEFTKPDGSRGKGVLATFKVFDEKLREILRNAWNAGKKAIVGFSIDAVGEVEQVVESTGKAFNKVLDFIEMPEVTVVDRPGAGGILLRMLASQTTTQESNGMREILKMLRELVPHLVENIKDEMSDDEVTLKVTEVLQTDPVKVALGTIGKTVSDVAQAGAQITEEQIAKIAESIVVKTLQEKNTQAAALINSRYTLESKLKESKLPEAEQKEILQEHFDHVMTEQEINTLLKRRQDKWAALKESGVNVPGQEEVTVRKDQEDKWTDAMTGMLFGQPVNNQTPFFSLHESFSEITGIHGNREKIGMKLYNDIAHAVNPNPLLMNQGQWRSHLRESRLTLREAALATTTWAEVFGDSVRRAMIMFYQEADWSTWRLIVSEISSAPDFRTMRRVRIGGLADLNDVSELGTYQEISIPADEEETFAVGKKGNLFSYSMESAINDDLGALRRIPLAIGRSAARGLYKSVFDVIRTNPTMGDGVALFHANHGNLGSTAFDSTPLFAAIQAMRDQTELSSGEVLGNAAPKYIVYPNELEKTVWEQAKASVSSASSARTETVNNFFLTFGLTPLPPIGYWTDTNDWALIGDPRVCPTIEVSFLNGRQEPEILIQDQQTTGSVFTADKITFKGRFIYGVKCLDHRFLYKAVVT